MLISDEELKQGIDWIKENNKYLFETGFSKKEIVVYILSLLQDVQNLRKEISLLKKD